MQSHDSRTIISSHPFYSTSHTQESNTNIVVKYYTVNNLLVWQLVKNYATGLVK